MCPFCSLLSDDDLLSVINKTNLIACVDRLCRSGNNEVALNNARYGCVHAVRSEDCDIRALCDISVAEGTALCNDRENELAVRVLLDSVVRNDTFIRLTLSAENEL